MSEITFHEHMAGDRFVIEALLGGNLLRRRDGMACIASRKLARYGDKEQPLEMARKDIRELLAKEFGA